jgi:ankyrin repeat protein
MGVIADFNDKSFRITETYIQENLYFFSDVIQNNLLQQAIEVGRHDLVLGIVEVIAQNAENPDYSLGLLNYQNRRELCPLYFAVTKGRHDLFDLMVQRLPAAALRKMHLAQRHTRDPMSFEIFLRVWRLPLKSIYCLINKICDGSWEDFCYIRQGSHGDFRLGRGLALNVVEPDLKNVWHIAIENDYRKIIDALLEINIPHEMRDSSQPFMNTLINRPDRDRKTPLDYCVDKGDRALFNRLVEHGAEKRDSVSLLHQLLNSSHQSDDFLTWVNEVGEKLSKEAIGGFSDYEVLALEEYIPNHPHHAVLHQRNQNFLQFKTLLKSDELPKIAKLFGGYEGLVSRIVNGAPSNAAEVLSHVGLLITMKEQAAGDSKKIAQLQASLESFRSGKTASVPTSSATYKKTATDENKGLLSNSSSSSSRYGLFKKK